MGTQQDANFTVPTSTQCKNDCKFEDVRQERFYWRGLTQEWLSQSKFPSFKRLCRLQIRYLEYFDLTPLSSCLSPLENTDLEYFGLIPPTHFPSEL